MTASIASPTDVLAFWRAAGPDRWFCKDAGFDTEIRARFLPTYELAAAGGLSGWDATAADALAHVIVLDQFPRNMFRGDALALAFAADPLALAAAEAALARGFDAAIEPDLRIFIYLPLMHAEDLSAQERCVGLCAVLGDAENLRFAEIHREIIRQFGRFPHRNAALGRTTTAAEQAYLDAGGFAG